MSMIDGLKHTARRLVREPGFTLVALLTIALGVGATTAVFSIVNGVLLRPVRFPDAERAVFILESSPENGIQRISVSPANFWDWRDQSTTFEAMAAIRRASFNLTGQEEPERLSGLQVSAGFFTVAGNALALGRGFLESEDRPGGDLVVVISHQLWLRRFRAEPDIIGRTLSLNNEVYTVVGVARQEVGFPSNISIWAPLAWDYRSYPRDDKYLGVMGLLKPGVTLSEARADLDRVADQLALAFPETNQGWQARVDPLLDVLVGSIRPRLLVLLGAVSLVLLIAVANVSHLQLARASGRQGEIALRQAIGAGRGQIIRQLLGESLVLGLLGGALGLTLAVWSTDAILGLFARYIPHSGGITFNARVLSFTAFVSIGASLLFGLLPALQASSRDISNRLSQGSRTATDGARSLRARTSLVTGEVALALVLLVAAGLLVRSFANLVDIDPGFSSERTLVMKLDLPEASYNEPAIQAAFFKELLSHTRAIPGVESAGTVAPLPLGGEWIGEELQIEGEAVDPHQEAPGSNLRFISPDYFKTMQIPLLAGRTLAAFDTLDRPSVVVVNHTFAERYFTNGDAIGKRLTFDLPVTEESRWHTIVGIVGDVHWAGLDNEAGAEAYLSVLQNPYLAVNLVVRVRTTETSLIDAVRNAVYAVDEELPVYSVMWMEDLLARSIGRPRFTMILLVLFAGLALSLAAIGTFGVLSYTVSQRVRDVAIRLALGANPRDVLAMLLRQGMTPVVVGVAVGLPGAAVAVRLLTNQVFGVGTTDPLTFLVAAGFLTTVSLTATYLAARRATRIDPAIVLRAE
jgi:putative ABC transport system permease protein